MALGYQDPAYAAALAEFGVPRALPECGGFILERTIPGEPDVDAMGCYPLFACRDWGRLPADVAGLGQSVVSLTLVTDPFAGLDPQALGRTFDRVMPFKEHHAIDTALPGPRGSRHHRYRARVALRALEVEECRIPGEHLDEWCALYATLTGRHGITGLKAFSRTSFQKQLALDGLIMFRARHAGETVAIHLWSLQGDVAHSHLTALSATGYALAASYALYATAIDALAPRARWLNLGAGAGIGPDERGLAQFKRGWANTRRPTYLCGKRCDPARYAALAAKTGTGERPYFPCYRDGELA